MKSPYDIIVKPHITERTVALSYGDPRIKDEEQLTRKYTFVVDRDANKIEIKAAIEAIYNAGKKVTEAITVEKVHVVKILGKKKRRGQKTGYQPDRKKAIITLKKGQVMEDYGV